MARLSASNLPRAIVARLAWGARRATRLTVRRAGIAWLVIALSAVVTIGAWFVYGSAVEQMAELTARRAALVLTLPRPRVVIEDDASRLAAFQTYLLPHEDIPVVIQDLLALAETEHLLLPRGDYKAQVDPQGGFMRYRMTLPVKGDGQAVYRFMLAALTANPTLALESVQFKRDAIASTVVEARIQWALLTRPPTNLTRSVSGATP